MSDGSDEGVLTHAKLSQLNENGRRLYAEGGRYQVTRVMNDDGQQVNARVTRFCDLPLTTEAG